MAEIITFIHSRGEDASERVSLFWRNENERKQIVSQLFSMALEGFSKKEYEDREQRMVVAAQIYSLVAIENPLLPAKCLAEMPIDEKLLDIRVIDVETGYVLYGDPNDIPVYDIEYFDEHDDGTVTVGWVDLDNLANNPGITKIRGSFNPQGIFVPMANSPSSSQ